jgi:hypothetical protein
MYVRHVQLCTSKLVVLTHHIDMPLLHGTFFFFITTSIIRQPGNANTDLQHMHNLLKTTACNNHNKISSWMNDQHHKYKQQNLQKSTVLSTLLKQPEVAWVSKVLPAMNPQLPSVCVVIHLPWGPGH